MGKNEERARALLPWCYCCAEGCGHGHQANCPAYYRPAVAAALAAAKVEGAKWARDIAINESFTALDAEIAALERGKGDG